MSFFVAEFVLLMQFLWKNIDDILGKGFNILEIMELIFYFGVTIIPLSVPVTILISSVMVFGNLSERYELSSLKSAGIPLTRIMKSAMLLAIATGAFSLLASNYLKPKANFKFQQRFRAIQKSKSSLLLEEGIFDDDFSGYIIRVGQKDKNGRDISDVLMYDQEHNNNAYLANITSAKSGEMYTSDDGNLFVMNLKDGEQIKELSRSGAKEKGKKYPLMRTYFKEYKKVFDMRQFEVDEDDVNVNRNKKDMLNTFQLLGAVDSIELKKSIVYQQVGQQFTKIILYPDSTATSDNTAAEDSRTSGGRLSMQDVVKKYKDAGELKQAAIAKTVRHKTPIRKLQKDSYDLDTITALVQTVLPSELKTLYSRTNNAATNQRDVLRSRLSSINALDKTKSRYLYTLHQQYAWALSCVVFLFIGAPLGSIIRKGGYGYPLLFAIVFYMILFIMTIMGNKLNRNGTLSYLTAAYLPIMVLLPFALIITQKALNDSKFSLQLKLPDWLQGLRDRQASKHTPA